MLQQVLSQLVIYSTNTVNINLVERGDNGANVSTAELVKIVKLVSRFFERMENHILEGSHPDSVPSFTPRDSNPNHKVSSMIVIGSEERSAAEKTKSDASPPGTPARDRISKKPKLKAGAGSKDFRKAGLLRCKEGTPIGDLFPLDLSKKYCSFFCFHDKNAPSQSSLVISNMLANGIRFPSKTRPKFSSIAMPVVERSGLTLTLSLSIGSRTFPKSLHTS